MQCIYCPTWCTLIAHYPNATHIWWKCESCKNVYFLTDLKHNISLINFKHKAGNKTYQADLYLKELRTVVHYHEPYPAKYTFGGAEPDIQEIFVDINTLLKITPTNFLQKLTLYTALS